ncbi:hypothetical protein ACFL1X_09505 [Candidatus Hydrogenedentota bacterium]
MDKNNVISLEDRVISESRSTLDELLQNGAEQMLQMAIENEVSSCNICYGKFESDFPISHLSHESITPRKRKNPSFLFLAKAGILSTDFHLRTRSFNLSREPRNT